MSGAAGRLGCSQPAVSRNIARLELILATWLFERRHLRGVGLTEAGQELLPDAATMVAAHDKIASRRTGERGRSVRRRVPLRSPRNDREAPLRVRQAAPCSRTQQHRRLRHRPSRRGTVPRPGPASEHDGGLLDVQPRAVLSGPMNGCVVSQAMTQPRFEDSDIAAKHERSRHRTMPRWTRLLYRGQAPVERISRSVQRMALAYRDRAMSD